jgi:GDP-L-fucose synthase
MKILVLGGHGFVGRNAVEVLNTSGYEVIPLSRRDGLDLTDYALTSRYFKEINPEVIVNCAAKVGSLNYVTKEAAEVFDTNMRMVLNIYKAAQDIIPEAIIINPIANCAFPGSLETYKEDFLWDGKVHQSVLSYGSTRRMMMVLSECYAMQYGLRAINFFVPNMYGPYDSTDPNKAHALNALISKVIKLERENKKEIEVWGSGIAVREWLFAKDFGRILLETISKINDDYDFNKPLNIAQNYGLSVKKLLTIIVKHTGFVGTVVWNRNMPDGAPCKIMDDTQFRKVFFDFQFTGLEEGIKATISYYESIYPY